MGKQERGKGRHVRRKNIDECGKRIRSLVNFQRHITATGHSVRQTNAEKGKR